MSEITQTADAGLDTQAQIQAAVSQYQTEFSAQFEQQTGHKDVKSLIDSHQQDKSQLQASRDHYKGQFEKLQIDSAILAETAQAVSPTIIRDLLAGKAACDENGNVTIDGKPVADAIQTLLDQNPFLAKPQGGTGSGAPANAGSITRQVSRDEFNKMQPDDRQKFLKYGGKIV